DRRNTAKNSRRQRTKLCDGPLLFGSHPAKGVGYTLREVGGLFNDGVVNVTHNTRNLNDGVPHHAQAGNASTHETIEFFSKGNILFPSSIRTLNGVGQKVRRLEETEHSVANADFGRAHVFKGRKDVLSLAIETTQPFNKRPQRPHRVMTERIGKLPSGHACGTGKLPQSLIIRLNRLAHVDEHAAES